MHQIRCRLWESLQRSPDPLAGFKGPTSNRRGKEGGEVREGEEGKVGEGKEGERGERERDGRKGMGRNPLRKNLATGLDWYTS